MSARLVLEGLIGVRAEFQRLAPTLTLEAQAVMQQEGEAAVSEMRAAYPSRTGNLRRGLRLTPTHQGPFNAGLVIRNRAPHAVLFEFGTQARHTALGANRGAMPPGHVFVPARERAQRRVVERLRALLQQHGLVVSGDAR